MAGSHSCYNALPDRRYWRPSLAASPLGSRSREPAATPSAAGSSTSQVQPALVLAPYCPGGLHYERSSRDRRAREIRANRHSIQQERGGPDEQ